MKLEHLTVEGFGPFAAAQRIDFRPLDEAGLFLITGRTGGGKSSLLDAVCFALYGGAPRYDGGRSRLRSDHVGPDTPTRVELEFVVAGERWRVTRSPEYERPKRRGEGTTLQKEEAELARWSDGGWAVLATRAVDVAELLEPVLQLTRGQFLQVILLAQGRFQEFLQARSEDRLALLRTLFGTERFARFEADLAERAKALEATVAAAETAIDADLIRLAELAGVVGPPGADGAWAEEVALSLAAEAVHAEAVEAGAQAAFATADRAAVEAAALAAVQRRRRDARVERARLAETQPEVDALRSRLAGAVRALPVIPHAEGVERATLALGVSAVALAAAESHCGGASDPDAEAAALAERIGALEGALEDERALPSLRASLLAASTERVAAEGRLDALRIRSAELPVLRESMRDRRSVADVRASAAPAARDALVRAEAARDAVARSALLEIEAARADVALVEALDAERAAATGVRDLVSARIAGAAAVLAASLEDGDACPVCGSTSHPALAPAADGVDDDAIDAASVRQDAAARARDAAAERSSAVRADLAAARVQAGGLNEQQVAAAVAAAVQAVEVAAGAADELRTAAEQLDALDAEASELAVEVSSAEQRVAALVEDVTVRAERLEGALLRVEDARADAASVADRARGLRRRHEALVTLIAAREDHDRCVADLAEADARLTTALQDAAIADAETARRSAMTATARSDAEAEIERHAAASSACEAVLAEAEVAAAPEDPADVPGTAAAKAAALERRVEAVDRRSTARALAADAARLARAVRDAEDGIAADRERLAVLAPLAATIRGDGANEKRMRLESYVLAARLEQIVAAANVRLAAMTDGRFALRHDDSVGYRNIRSGLGLEVFDEHTGRPRPIASLSGGETFLASLALALGLAEVVSAEAGGVRLDTLFVDEGFGALDRETLDTAMATLDSLRAGGRVVGLISHVEAMQEDVPAGLHVERTPSGPSVVRLRAPVSARG